jgi:four helix bundle protein
MGGSDMRGDDLSERLIDFGVRVIRLIGAMPRGIASRHVASQLMRSGTSCGANYEEARGGESLADFVHKLSVCWKESRESLYWLKLIHRAELVKPNRIEPLLQESKELVAILSKSLETCRKKGSPKASPESDAKN